MQSKPVLILLGIIILVFAWSVLGFWNKMQETAQNKKIIEDKVAALNQQKQKLVSDINSLNTDQGKEKFFRENYGLAKDGEDVIVVVEDKTQSAAPIKAPSSGFLSSLFFWKNWFK
jgi:cell division protein FtsB